MGEELIFLNFDGLDDYQEKEILMHLSPFARNPDVEFPWDSYMMKVNPYGKGDGSVLNVYAPSFQSVMVTSPYDQSLCIPVGNPSQVCYSSYPNCVYGPSNSAQISSLNQLPANAEIGLTNQMSVHLRSDVNGNSDYIQIQNVSKSETEMLNGGHPYKQTFSENKVTVNTSSIPAPMTKPPFSGNRGMISAFRLSPTVSSFVPQSNPPFVTQTSTSGLTDCKVIESQMSLEVHNDSESTTLGGSVNIPNTEPVRGIGLPENSSVSRENCGPCDGYTSLHKTDVNVCQSICKVPEAVQAPQHITNVSSDTNTSQQKVNSSAEANVSLHKTSTSLESCHSSHEPGKSINTDASSSSQESMSTQVKPAFRSFADVLKSRVESSSSSHPPVSKPMPLPQRNEQLHRDAFTITDEKKSSIRDDKLAINLGRHLYQLQLDYSPLSLQPRGLINRRNWCYVNATLQALLACSPFYTLLRNLPIGPLVDRGKSSTPVIDSMVSLAYELVKVPDPQEEFQPGVPFEPVTIYEMLGNLKSDCLKGQQEDAEEFLSYILNGMHEEMVSIIKNYEEKHNLSRNEEMKANGHVDASDGEEEEWQVIGAKQRGMVTRKVMEHKTPISDLLGGQIKSFLSTSGNKTSASVQPFFTLQLDIQSENVTSVEEALSQMTAKEPIQGYTCAKTKQEVEAYSHVTLQKLPPVLILHLKRFVYNKTGGCKKVMKHTEYPINLELKKELFSPEAKRMKRLFSYKLFAVMYHDGEEAVKGHYISDIYHHGSKSWIRCDDRVITSITEAQVTSHSPPRVPYLLFYQVNN